MRFTLPFMALFLVFQVFCFFALGGKALAQDGFLEAPADFLQSAPDAQPPEFPPEEEPQPADVIEEGTKLPAFDEVAVPETNQEIPAPTLDALLEAQPPEPSDEADRDDLKDVPDEYIIEALAYGDECAANANMRMYFDCQCLAVKHLDKRIALGKDADVSMIRFNLGPECADGTGIAGKMYQECASGNAPMPKDKDPEEFCACYGNTYGKLYEDLGQVLRSPQHVRLMAQARMACTDSAQARRIFGNNPLFPKNVN